MKTIAQIASEIGVSKQAVQKKIAREPLCTELIPYISTNNGTKYIDDTGEAMIKSAYQKSEQQPIADNVHIDTPTTTDNVYIVSLQDEIKFLRDENSKLTDKLIEQSEHLLLLTEQAQKIAENAQTLHALENVKPQLTEEKKVGFFKRIFNKH